MVAAPGDVHGAVLVDRAEVAGGVPAFRVLGVVAVPIGAQQGLGTDLQLAVDGPHRDAGQRSVAVHHAASALGHAIGAYDVGGTWGRVA